MFKKRSAKIAPSSSSSEVQREERTRMPSLETMRVMSLQTLFKLYGGQRHPRLDSYDTLRNSGELLEWRYVPLDATTIYISHEWTGSSSPDHDGTQMYHLLLLLERLKNGLVPRTEMDAGHVMIYKQNHTTTSQEWKRMLDSSNTFIWYDGFCIPKSRREDSLKSIPAVCAIASK